MSKSAIGIEGDKKLLRKLNRMVIKRKDALKAVAPSARLVRDAARANVPQDTGALRRSIQARVLPGLPATYSVRPAYEKKVNARSGKVTAGFHAHLVEFGTGRRPATAKLFRRSRKVVLNGRVVRITHTGVMPARPFMRPAWDQTQTAVSALLRRNFWALVKRLAREQR